MTGDDNDEDEDDDDDDSADDDDGDGANEGRYDPERCEFKRVRTVYLARPCTGCRKDTRDYCSCDPSIDLCSACFGAHRVQHCG
jgi:hypothetical protein